MAVFLKRASRRDCEAVIADIRPADEAELIASDGDARMVVIKGWLASPSYCWAGYDECGRTLGVFDNLSISDGEQYCNMNTGIKK